MHNYREEILNSIFKLKKKKNPRELSSPIHYSKKLKHKHKQENQIDENILHE